MCSTGKCIFSILKVKNQKAITLSSGKSECVNISECAWEFSLIRKLFLDISHYHTWTEYTEFTVKIIIVNRTAAIALDSSPTASIRGKYISIKHHHVQEIVRCGIIRGEHVNSGEKPAESLT